LLPATQLTAVAISGQHTLRKVHSLFEILQPEVQVVHDFQPTLELLQLLRWQRTLLSHLTLVMAINGSHRDSKPTVQKECSDSHPDDREHYVLDPNKIRHGYAPGGS
jgi:hypothetical protein